MTTPTAAVAAPVAATAPAPASAPAAAPAAITPAVAPAPVVTAPPAGDSLVDSAPLAVAPSVVTDPSSGAVLTEAQRIVEAARVAAQPNASGAAWNLTDTVPGAGEKPSWYKQDKYVNVAKQAEAYVELEKRFGSFTGAPKNEKGIVEYKAPPLDGVVITDPNHPVLTEFNKLAAEMQLSQDGYNKLLGMMAQYEASQAPDIAEAKAALGPNADARITSVVNWAKNNLDANGFQLMRAVTAGHEAAPAFALLEAMIAKTGTVRLPAPGTDTAPTANQGLGAIRDMQAKKNDKGQRLYEIDANYRREVDAALQAHFASNPVVRDRQGNIRG